VIRKTGKLGILMEKEKRTYVLVAGCQSVTGATGVLGDAGVIPAGSWLLNSGF